jgi:cytoskeletal protein CcmA (bactofilin family)
MGADRPHGSDRVDSLVSAGTLITGTISFCGGLRVDGEVRGLVRCIDGRSGTLVVGEKGRIDGDVEVARLITNGMISGRARVGEFVKVQSRARVHCDLEYAAVEIHAGAVVEGRLSHRQQTIAAGESIAATAPAPVLQEPAADLV